MRTILRRKSLWALAATLVLASAAAVAGSTTAPRLDKQGPVYRLERGETVYCFDSAWRIETLWQKDAAGSWQRVLIPDPARLAELRNVLLVRIDRASIGSIPVEGTSAMRAVASLGYF